MEFWLAARDSICSFDKVEKKVSRAMAFATACGRRIKDAEWLVSVLENFSASRDDDGGALLKATFLSVPSDRSDCFAALCGGTVDLELLRRAAKTHSFAQAKLSKALVFEDAATAFELASASALQGDPEGICQLAYLKKVCFSSILLLL